MRLLLPNVVEVFFPLKLWPIVGLYTDAIPVPCFLVPLCKFQFNWFSPSTRQRPGPPDRRRGRAYFLPSSVMKRLHIQQIPAAARKGRAVLLKIEGELVADNVPPVQELLLGVLPEAKSVRLVLQQVESLDLAFVQLLWSARRTAAALNKSFAVEATLPDELRTLLQTAGLDGFPAYTHQPAPSHA